MPVSEATRAILEARRDVLNARFVRMGRGRDPAAFLRFVERTIDPLVVAGGGEAALFALFDLGLIGMPHGLVGEREASRFEATLVEELPRFGQHFQKTPGPLVTIVANGFDRIARELSLEHGITWLRTLASIAGLCPTRPALLDAGLMIAWRTGLAEARDAVYALAPRASLVNALFGVDALDPSPAHRFRHPATTTLGPLDIVATVGGFVGFGGSFRVPPTLTCANGNIFATDGDRSVRLFADAFGARLCAATIPAPQESTPPDGFTISARGEVAWTQADGEVVRGAFPSLMGARAGVAASGVAAVTLPTSHLLFVLGRREKRD